MAVITASPSNFQKLLNLQEKSLEHVSSIRMLIEGGAQVQAQTTALEKIQKDNAEQVKLAKEEKKSREEQERLSKAQVAEITDLAKNIQTFNSVGERITSGFKQSLDNLKKPFTSMAAFKENVFKRVNVFGLANKSVAREQFVQQQKSLGTSKSDKELRQDFEKRNQSAKAIQSNEKAIADLMKSTGFSEKELAQTDKGKELLDLRSELAASFGPDRRVSDGQVKEAPVRVSKTKVVDENADLQVEQKELMTDNLEQQKEQTHILEKIKDNLSGNAGAAGGSGEGGGGGFLKGLGSGLAALGKGLKAFGTAAGKGIELFLKGLAKGLSAIANPLTLVGLGALTLAAIGLGKALELAAPGIEAFAPILIKIADVIQNVVLGAINALAPTIESAGTAISEVVTSIGNSLSTILDSIAASITTIVTGIATGIDTVVNGIATSITTIVTGIATSIDTVVNGIATSIATVINSISDGIVATVDSVTSAIERLAALDGTNLLSVGAGLLAVSGGMAAFAAANVAGGLTNLVSGFLSFVSGQKTPIEQLELIAGFGDGLDRAGSGIQRLAAGLSNFNDIDPDKLRVLSRLPLERLAAVGANLPAPSAPVAVGSAANAALSAAPASSANITTVAPVTNVQNNRNVVTQLPSRNPDNSFNRMLDEMMIAP